MPFSIHSKTGAIGLALERAESDSTRATRRLASGKRINAAADDAAGLAIAGRLTSRARGLSIAGRNALDAVSMTQTAEGAVASIAGNLQRLRELSVQAANATNSASERALIHGEARQLVSEIDRIATTTRFNGQPLLDGSVSSVAFQVGADPGQTVTLAGLHSARTETLGVAAPVPTTTSVSGSTLTAASTLTGPGQLVINGIDVWQGTPIAADASALANAINGAGITGLTVTAAPNVAAGTWSAGPPDGTVAINGSTLGYYFGTVDQATSAMVMLMVLNGGSFPGIVASDNGAGITLTAPDGRNIALNFTTGHPAILGLGGIAFGVGYDGVTYSHVDVSYTGLNGLSISGSKATALGLPLMTAPPPQGPPAILSQINLETASGAVAALAAIDASLATVNDVRAQLGASQNRLGTALEQIRSAALEASAGASRIVDADFAQETARLTRSRILQQAGTALLAQANAARSDVLRLLKG